MDFERRFPSHSHRTMMSHVARGGIEAYRLRTVAVARPGFARDVVCRRRLRAIFTGPRPFRSYFGNATNICLIALRQPGHPCETGSFAGRTAFQFFPYARVRDDRSREARDTPAMRRLTLQLDASQRTAFPASVSLERQAGANGAARIACRQSRIASYR